MDYKELSESLKEQGNEAFKRNDVEEAIRLYSQAIEVNPDNYVAFSNRSAAYLKSDFKSKALYDAEKCMNLAPDWIKSYNRLGVAQHALKRFDAAIDTFKRGISIEPNNQSLWGALKSCEEAKEIDKRERFAAAAEERLKEEEKLKRQNEQMEAVKEKEKGQEEDLLSSFLADIGTETSVNPKVDLEKDNAVNNSEDLLCGFFAEVSTPVLDNNSVAKVIINNITGDAITVVSRDESQMTEKYMNQELGTGHEQIQRLAAQHYQWKNLNPYFVLQLDIDATIEDIKYRYKKLSAKVHPDKMRDNESARTAFEEVKIAYQKLLDEEQRKNIIANIEVVKDNIMKERKKIEKGASVENLPSLEEVLEKEIMKHFAEVEMMRLRSEKNRRIYNARDKQLEKMEQDKLIQERDFEMEWSEEQRRDNRVGNWREFSTEPISKKARISSYKEQHRVDQKHGVVDSEVWRKSWK